MLLEHLLMASPADVVVPTHEVSRPKKDHVEIVLADVVKVGF
jgi:hypothetical protein